MKEFNGSVSGQVEMSIGVDLKLLVININNLKSIITNANINEAERETLKYLYNKLDSVEQLNMSYRAWKLLFESNIKTIDNFLEYVEVMIKYNLIPDGMGKVTKNEIIKTYKKIKGEQYE